MLKRGFDLTFSFIVLVTTSPILLLTAAAIKADSEGPVLFKQKRPGINNEIFDMYKFRSMKVGAPNVETAKLGDGVSHITKVGKFIRKTSIDELPQLINVFNGQMSIIGPRPALYNQYELIEKRTVANVHTVKPGITGYAQVMGRDELSDEEKVSYDRYYIENQSFKLDMWILWKTLTSVVTSKDVSH